MSALYFLLAPIIFLSFYKSIRQLAASVQAGNHNKLKAAIFFLSLQMIVLAIIVAVIEWK